MVHGAKPSAHVSSVEFPCRILDDPCFDVSFDARAREIAAINEL